MQKKILLVQCYAAGKVGSPTLFRSPSEYRTHLLETYPEMKNWATKEIFENIREWPDDVNMYYYADEVNVVGRLFAENIDTPSTVIDPPVTPELITKELEKDSYTHVGFSVILNAYTNFLNCVNAVKKFDPSIITIAGGAGAIYEGTEKYVDHLCRNENGVSYIRRLLGEDVSKLYNLVIMPDHLHVKYGNSELTTDICRVITNVGCPFDCNFCSTPVLHNREFTGALFSPQQVHDALVAYREGLKLNKLQVYFVDPTTIYSLEWWYKLFELFKNDDGDYSFILYGVLSILDKLNLNRVSKSAARLYTINFGIESFGKRYSKIGKVDIKSLIKRLSDYGIMANPNYIIGFDFDTKESVKEDIKKMIDLDGHLNTVLNLHPNPGTDVWDEYAYQERLLDVPPDFYHIHGFQSYTHPEFKPGFEDILPLLCDIYNYIETETGNLTLNIIGALKNLLNHTNHPKMVKREINTYKGISKMLYPKWKQFFTPSEIQDQSFLAKLQ